MELLKKNPALLIALVGILIVIGYLYSRVQALNPSTITTSEQKAASSNCVPTFRDGGGPYYKANVPFREKIAPDKNSGEILIVEGKILENDCKTPVTNAVLDVWQANESGNYEDEFYRGRMQTDENGQYLFETVIPKGYGEGTGYRPPHIHFKVHIDGNEAITSQMFFPEVIGREGFDDAYIMTVKTTEGNGKTIHSGYHDIILP